MLICSYWVFILIPPLSDVSIAQLSNQTKQREWLRHRLSISLRRYLLTGVWGIALAGLTAFDSAWLSPWERQVQTFLFDLRGPIVALDDIIVLAIDQESLALGREYLKMTQEYLALEPIQTWPWKRQIYAIAIDKLMAAGA